MVMSGNQFYDKIRLDIVKHKRSLVGVFPVEPEGHEFVYTIGNYNHGLPELLVVGTCAPDIGEVINLLSDKMLERGAAFADGELIDLGGLHPVAAVHAHNEVKDLYTIQATRYSGDDGYEVIQIVLPDRHGRFPWDKGCQKLFKVKIYRAHPVIVN